VNSINRWSSALSENSEQEKRALQPTLVTINEARKLLANKGRSQIYDAIADGKLVAFKDGKKTLIAVESIDRYLAQLPVAQIKKYIRRGMKAMPR
jgi:excisionase family DNA binding protein